MNRSSQVCTGGGLQKAVKRMVNLGILHTDRSKAASSLVHSLPLPISFSLDSSTTHYIVRPYVPSFLSFLTRVAANIKRIPQTSLSEIQRQNTIESISTPESITSSQRVCHESRKSPPIRGTYQPLLSSNPSRRKLYSY